MALWLGVRTNAFRSPDFTDLRRFSTENPQSTIRNRQSQPACGFLPKFISTFAGENRLLRENAGVRGWFALIWSRRLYPSEKGSHEPTFPLALAAHFRHNVFLVETCPAWTKTVEGRSGWWMAAQGLVSAFKAEKRLILRFTLWDFSYCAFTHLAL